MELRNRIQAVVKQRIQKQKLRSFVKMASKSINRQPHVIPPMQRPRGFGGSRGQRLLPYHAEALLEVSQFKAQHFQAAAAAWG